MQYSMIAVLVLMAVFLTLTLSATALLVAFCKKNNSVFSLTPHRPDHQRSNLEMDHLHDSHPRHSRKNDSQDVVTDDSCNELDDSSPPLLSPTSSRRRQQRHTLSWPEGQFDQSAMTPTPTTGRAGFRRQSAEHVTVAAIHRHGDNQELCGSDSHMCGEESQGLPRGDSRVCGGDSQGSRSGDSQLWGDHIQELCGGHNREIHSSCVTVNMEDADITSDISNVTLPRYVHLREEREGEGEESEESEADDEIHNDQTQALLRS